jgi:hypothetical protein
VLAQSSVIKLPHAFTSKKKKERKRKKEKKEVEIKHIIKTNKTSKNQVQIMLPAYAGAQMCAL